ncbi:MAG: RNA polymerase sigma factor [Anaerolineales bacterium]|nr:RNA polymerase sigma factor [Anaerolineales bacterium]MCB9126349.1 RNA polymerase sigma factor [Ardenticatenales bacterium]
MTEQFWPMAYAERDPDIVLVKAMAAGEATAIESLYQRHGPALFAYLVGQLGDRQWAEDVLQEVMLAAWRSAARFRGESTVRTWLLAIARYRALNARQRRPPPPDALPPDLPTDDPKPHQKLEHDAQRDEIARALQQLPAAQRETLELIFFHGLSGPEAAQVQKVAIGTIKSRLHRAKAALRHLLSKEEEDA